MVHASGKEPRIHALAEVEPGAELGAGTTVWRFCHVMAGARIGQDCMLGQGCFVANGAVLGHGVRLQNQVSVFSGVILEDKVFCGPSVVFTNVKRPRAFATGALETAKAYATTRVQKGATLGANATILPGLVLGQYCFVAAGAVVTRSVPAFALVMGVPARQVGWVSHAAERLDFENGKHAVCGRTGRAYRLTPDGPELLER